MSEVRRPGTLSVAFLEDATSESKDRFRDLLSQAGIRMRTESGRLAFRSDPSPPPMVLTKPLQRSTDGVLRADCRKTLRMGDLLDEQAAEDTVRFFRSRYAAFIPGSEGRAEKILPTSFDGFQMELLWNLDELPVLEKWTQAEWNGKVRLHRIITTRALHLRDLFWRFAKANQDEGLTLQRMIDEKRWPKLDQVSGTVVSQAGLWIAAPMAARAQPFAAVFTTAWGAELVALPEGAWNRDSYQPLMWPVGFGGVRLSGSGVDAYARMSDEMIPHNVATDLLAAQTRGVNQLLLGLTDPGRWTTADGALDVEERSIAWSTVNLGLTAIRDIAQQWGTDVSVWAAFRALGILSGYWTPPGGAEVKIAALVSPAIVQEFACRRIGPDWLQRWCRDVVNNWESVLNEMFPNVGAAEATQAVQELRNLLHGVGAAPTRSRARGARLEAYSTTGESALQLVRDVANFWWMALVQNPATHGLVGRPPF